MSDESKLGWKDRIAASAKAAQDKLVEAKAKSDAKPKIVKFSGVSLIGSERIESKQGGGPIAGAHARVETLGQIRGRRTIKTLGLHQKKIDERESYLTIEGIGWEITVEVDPKDGAEAREFAARVNSIAKQSETSSTAEVLWTPSCTACKWMGDRAQIDAAQQEATVHDTSSHSGNKTAVLIGDGGIVHG